MTDLTGYQPGELEAATAGARLENGIIPHPMLDDGLKRLRMHQARSYVLVGSKPQPSHLLVVTGAPGAGKTTLLEQHGAAFPNVTDDDGIRMTFVRVEMPSPCTRKQLVEAIFTAMGHQPSEDWKTTKIVDEIAAFADRHYVRMIGIDEADRIFGAETAEVAKFLVSLLNKVKAQIVLAGAPEITALNTGWGLGRRLEKDLVLNAYRWDTGEGQKAFRAMLGVFEARMGLSERSMLNEFHLARRMYVASEGHVGIVSKLLVEALLAAHQKGCRKVTADLLGEVYAGFVRAEREPEEIDFDRDVEKDPAKPQAPLAKADNPFLCTEAQLKTIWIALKRKGEEAEAKARGQRKTGAVGRGAKST